MSTRLGIPLGEQFEVQEQPPDDTRWHFAGRYDTYAEAQEHTAVLEGVGEEYGINSKLRIVRIFAAAYPEILRRRDEGQPLYRQEYPVREPESGPDQGAM